MWEGPQTFSLPKIEQSSTDNHRLHQTSRTPTSAGLAHTHWGSDKKSSLHWFHAHGDTAHRMHFCIAHIHFRFVGGIPVVGPGLVWGGMFPLVVPWAHAPERHAEPTAFGWEGDVAGGCAVGGEKHTLA